MTEARDKIKAVTGISWQPILEYAEKLGLGNREYSIEKVD